MWADLVSLFRPPECNQSEKMTKKKREKKRKKKWNLVGSWKFKSQVNRCFSLSSNDSLFLLVQKVENEKVQMKLNTSWCCCVNRWVWGSVTGWKVRLKELPPFLTATSMWFCVYAARSTPRHQLGFCSLFPKCQVFCHRLWPSLHLFFTVFFCMQGHSTPYDALRQGRETSRGIHQSGGRAKWRRQART